MKENKYTSRKYIMAYAVMILGTAGYLAAGRWPSLAVIFSEYCVFLIGVFGLYTGGNTAVKWVAAKNGARAVPEKSSGEESQS